jgi:hypothetical protein
MSEGSSLGLPFAITPHPVDHFGFDAYALEIDCAAPLRGNGRRPSEKS